MSKISLGYNFIFQSYPSFPISVSFTEPALLTHLRVVLHLFTPPLISIFPAPVTIIFIVPTPLQKVNVFLYCTMVLTSSTHCEKLLEIKIGISNFKARIIIYVSVSFVTVRIDLGRRKMVFFLILNSVILKITENHRIIEYRKYLSLNLIFQIIFFLPESLHSGTS